MNDMSLPRVTIREAHIEDLEVLDASSVRNWNITVN